jgi:hypothetical protein
LSIVLIVIVAFISGPLWGLKLDYEKGQQMQLIQIALPTFLSYLSSAVAYASVGNIFPEPDGERGRILRLICLGGLSIFFVGFTLSTVMFYMSADGTLKQGRLEYGQYTNLITMLLGILGVTTSAVTTFIFAARKPRG